ALTLPVRVAAETGYDAWLRYAAIGDRAVEQRYDRLPAVVAMLDDSAVVGAAQEELFRGVRGMLGRTLRAETKLPGENAILLGRLGSFAKLAPSVTKPPELKEDGYLLKTVSINGQSHLLVAALNARGVLYGAFALLRKIALHEPIDRLDERENPYA